MVPGAPRPFPRQRDRGRDRGVPASGEVLAGRRPVALRGGRGVACAGARSRHRPRGERRAALARRSVYRRAALRSDEARRRPLCGRLHHAQARGAEKLQEGAAANARGDARRVVAAPARAGLRRPGRHRGEHLRHPVRRRHERPAFPRAGRHAGSGLRRADRVVALPHAAHLRLHGSLVRCVRQGLPAFAFADRLRPRRVARRGPGRKRREAASTCRKRTPISCSR